MLLCAGLLTWLCAFTSAQDIFDLNSPEETSGLFQGDIVLTAEQRVLLQQRKALTDARYRWPREVLYRFGDANVNQEEVKKGIKHWEDNTCLKFKEVFSTTAGQHINFISSSGCWSYLGRVKTSQRISLPRYCSKSMGIVAHEIGHAMGFYHEQSRSDRDNYIKVLWNKITGGAGNINYRKANDNNFSIPYDYSSVMHYDSRFLEALDPLGQRLMGSRAGLSHMDVLLANIMYKCIDDYATSCKVAKTFCSNYGILKSDCSCVCPPGTSGKQCEVLDKLYLHALSEKNLAYTSVSASSGILKNSRYPNVLKGEIYKRALEAPTCHEIRINFNAFSLDPSNCVGNYLSLTSDGKTTRYCGNSSPGMVTISGNKVYLLYASTNTEVRGFSASYQFVKKVTCADVTTTTSPVVTTKATTNSPATYPTPATTIPPASTTLPPITLSPGSFEVINSGIIPLKAESSCSHVLTSVSSTYFNLKVTNWKPNCLIRLFTDEPRSLYVHATGVPAYMKTEAKSIMGKTTRLFRRGRVFYFENSNLVIRQTSRNIRSYYLAASHNYKYSVLDLYITVVNRECNKLIKMSSKSSGSITVAQSDRSHEHCEIWAKSPMGSLITIKVEKGRTTGRSCWTGQIFVDTEKSHSHMFKEVGLVCPKDMPATWVTEGCSGGVFVNNYRNYLVGVVVSFSTN